MKSLGTKSTLFVYCRNNGSSTIEAGDSVFAQYTKLSNNAGDTYLDCDIVTKDSAADASASLGIAMGRAYAGDYFETAFFGIVPAKVSTSVAAKDILTPGISNDGMLGKPTPSMQGPVMGFAFEAGAWTSSNRTLTLVYLNGLFRPALGL